MNRLGSKRALITGGTSGIGFETARQFLKEGARVAITGSNLETLEAARTELGDVLAIRADAGDVAARKAVADAVREGFGGLDILFVNAGIGDFRPLEQWDEARFDRSIAVNLKGPSSSSRRRCRFSLTLSRSCSTPRSTPTSACRTRASMRRQRQDRSRSPAPFRASSSRGASASTPSAPARSRPHSMAR